MVSGHGSTRGGGRYHAHRPGHPVGQAGLDESLLEKYRGGTAALSKPQERDEEKRNVHRVREYWLEHEAVKHLDQLIALKIPVATFEATFLQANAHNPKYARNTLRETMRGFFREHTDEDGVRFLTLKLSERPVCTKPSKNILKRWNLGNGMLYFFYAAVGRAAPPTGDEILEPFYYQKRVDFAKRVCGPPPATATTATATPKEEPVSAGSTAFFAEQLSLHGPRGRKRRRDGVLEAAPVAVVSPRAAALAAQQAQQAQQRAVLPLSALCLPALTPEGQPVTAPLVEQEEEAPVAVEVKSEPLAEEAAQEPEPEPQPEPKEIEEDAEVVAGLVAYLHAQVWAPIDPAAVAAAVRAGVWRRVAASPAGAAAGLEGCEGLDAETLGGYLQGQPSSNQEAEPAAEASRWAPDLAQLEAWSFENGALPAFVRACRLNWALVLPAWRAWNEDLGNNALEWGELWRAGQGGEPEAALDAEASEGSEAGSEMEDDPFAAGAGTSMGRGGGGGAGGDKAAALLMPFAPAAAAAAFAPVASAQAQAQQENAAASVVGSSPGGAGVGLLLTQNKAVPFAAVPGAVADDVFLVDLSQHNDEEEDAEAAAYHLAAHGRPKIEIEEEELEGLPQGVSAGSCDSVDSAATAAAQEQEAAAYWAADGGQGGEALMDLTCGGEGPLGLTDAELQLLFASAGLDLPATAGGAAPAGMGAAVEFDPSVVVGPLAPPVMQSQPSLGATAMVSNALF